MPSTRAKFHGEPPAYGAVEWADHLVRAWGRGDHAAVHYYATPSVGSALFLLRDPGAKPWARISARHSDGTMYVTYRQTASGEMLVVSITELAIPLGDAHLAYDVSYA